MTLTDSGTVSPSTIARTHPDQNAAIGLALGFVAPRAPFAAYRADRLVNAIVGQIQRRHYVFAIRGGRVVGYGGWALCPDDMAEAWLAGGPAPNSEQCLHGGVLVPMIVAANDGAAMRTIASHVRKLYPEYRYMGRRILPQGSRLQQGRVVRPTILGHLPDDE